MAEASDSANKSGLSSLISRWFRVSVVAVGFGMLVWVFRNRPLTLRRIAGICLMIPSLTLWLVAQFQLGDSFSLQPKARHLVTHGIYSRIRNPIYVFSTIFLAGMMLFLEWPDFMLLGLVAILAMQVFRARAEAKVLEEKFGDEYRAYRRRTWF